MQASHNYTSCEMYHALYHVKLLAAVHGSAGLATFGKNRGTAYPKGQNMRKIKQFARTDFLKYHDENSNLYLFWSIYENRTINYLKKDFTCRKYLEWR